jgi:hypothetical protein
MLVRDVKRLALFVVPLLLLLLITYGLWDPETSEQLRSHASAFFGKSAAPEADQAPLKQPPPPPPSPPPLAPPSNPHSPATGSGSGGKIELPAGEDSDATHHQLYSLSTEDRKYFPVKFGNESAFNPNILPHPTRDGTYVIVGQKASTDSDPNGVFFEIACAAAFKDGLLQCLDEAPIRLPIAPTNTSDAEKCKGELLTLLLMNQGPHDARVVYGPEKPYIIYGSNSGFTCFGMWIQDFNTLADWGAGKLGKGDFAEATELQRPVPWSAVEKNWFVFWDKDGQAYAHYDAVPSRSFAQLRPNGSVGPNLGPFAAEQDENCLAHYLPKLPPKNEDIHQATNSLRITMCKRADKDCKVDDTNTFIIAIIQHKTWYNFHGEYEPYAMVFRERSPFEVYAISKKPLWIHGRERRFDNTTDMVYVVGMNWKEKGLNYHGYLDDELFLTFGVDDKRAGAIDILASDLLTGLGLCSDV